MSDYPYHYSSAASPSVRKDKFKRRIGMALGAVALIALAYGAFRAAGALSNAKGPKRIKASELQSLWISGDFAAVDSTATAALEAYPLDPVPLVFKGLSAFYLGLAESDAEARMAYMDESVFALRKALTFEKAPLRAESLYVLGKAYFQKGVDYYSESLDCMRASLDAGYSAEDEWEYLALAAQGLGRTEESLGYFSKAIEAKPDSAELALAASIANASAGESATAERLAKRAMEGTEDEYLAERSAFVLGDLYVAASRFDEALALYGAIKEKNPQSADAWYYEGVAFEARGEPIKARASWRKAVSIDPMHAGARQKLSERN